MSKLPERLTQLQKKTKIHNLLRELARLCRICRICPPKQGLTGDPKDF